MLNIRTKKEQFKLKSEEEISQFIVIKNILNGQIKKLRLEYIQKVLSNIATEVTFTEFVKVVRRTFNSKTSTSFDYWYSRGYSDKECRIKVYEEQYRRSQLIPKERRSEIGKLRAKKYIEKYKDNFGQFSHFHADYWIKKGYSEEDAHKKAKETNNKYCSLDHLKTLYADEEIELMNKKKIRYGKKNGMYGRVSPRGTGAGISGFYKDMYFRSTYEYFWIKQKEYEGIEFDCLDDGIESKMLILVGDNRTYTPDFYIPSTRTIVDVKNKNSLTKIHGIAESIFEFCNTHKMSYETIDESELILDWRKLFDDVDSGIVVIDSNKIEKYRKYKNAKSNICKISFKI